MTEIKVQTHVDRALQVDGRVDATEAKTILDNILKDGVSSTELKDAEALVARATASADMSDMARLPMFAYAGELRRQGKTEQSEGLLDRMRNATEFKQFAQQLYRDLDVAYREQSVENKVSRFFETTWDAIWK